MRELKFRVWDNTYKEYVRPDYNIIGYVYPLDGTLGVKYLGDCTIEQYTGEKDKNGKEIYEGDVVKTESPNEGTNFEAGAIDYHQAMFLVCNAPKFSDPELTHSEILGYYCDTELEVIGNIHENPELLEGGK